MPVPFLTGAFAANAYDFQAFDIGVTTEARFVLGGVDVTPYVRKDGVTIHDILNDAPNTCALTFDGDAGVAQVGTSLRIALNGGDHLLFSGSLQTVDLSYEGGKPTLGAWPITAIDDTARANRRRPFGTWVTTSASIVAEAIAAGYAPDFDTAIEADLPAVTITFDGSEPFIACLVRLANLFGGYAKVEDNTVYLFLEDLDNPPDPVDVAHPPMNEPPITMTTDVSQLRTRVYGKGYGEHVPTDVAAGETILPIIDGAQFNLLGGQAIAGTTADGAQSQHIAYTGVLRPIGGTLVGPGASPANAPALGLAAGGVVTNGVHNVSVVHVTAVGKSLAGPVSSVTVGAVAAPTTAPIAGTPIAGTGPDQGGHDYLVTFAAIGGETTVGPISNGPVITNAALGEVASPVQYYSPTTAPLVDGNLNPASPVPYFYTVTYVTATGETDATGWAQALHPPPPAAPNYPYMSGTTGGALTPGGYYTYLVSFVTASGYETELYSSNSISLGGSQNAVTVTVPTSTDGRVTKRRIYRTKADNSPAAGNGGYFVGEINDNTTPTFMDLMADSALDAGTLYYRIGYGTPSGPRGTPPGYQVYLVNIPTGPAGVTARKIYRGNSYGGSHSSGVAFHYLATLSNNTATSYQDNTANNDAAADVPLSNTTGTAVQRIPVTNIPIGPPSTTARKLYRRFHAGGITNNSPSNLFKLVTTIANNTATTYTDSTLNSALGAAAPSTNTAVGNQIAMTAIPTGAAAVTQREIYMSPAGGGTRRLALTIANNTATTGTINLSDATLASQATEPATDTSGLAQPQGQVNPGSTSLIVASPAPFSSTGGWATLGGGQVVRYTSVSGQLLTGIPATGPGAIVTTVLYGQQALPTPSLVGVTGLALAMLKGAAVHIWVQRDDLLAQAEQAARDGSDGIVEFLISDERRAEASLIARCDADLALFSRPIVTVKYATRDFKSKSGKPVTITMTQPTPINQTLIIQDVTISEIDISKGLPPRFTVTASSVRFSLEDTLRRLVAS